MEKPESNTECSLTSPKTPNTTDEDDENLQPRAYIEIPCEDTPSGGNCHYTCDSMLDNVVNFMPNFDCAQGTENIIAFFWGAFVFFVGVIFIVAQYTTTLKKFSFTTTYWVLFVFLLFAIIGMAVAIKHRNSNKFTINYSEVDDETERSEETTSKYLIGCAYVFAIGNFLLDLFSMLTVFHCGLTQTTYTEKMQYSIQFLFHATRMIFTALQLIFLQVFITTKIQRTLQMSFKLLVVHVIATNFCIWFTFLCQETGVMQSDDFISGEYSVYNCTSDPHDQLFETAKTLSTYFQPFILEFSLLSAMLFSSMYPFQESFGKDRDRRRKYNYGAIDSVKRDDSKVYKSDPGVLLGLLCGLLLILASWSLQDDTHFLQNLRFNYYIQIITHLLIIIFSVLVLQEVKKYHSKENPNRKYKIEDYLLFVTGLAGFLPFFIAIFFSITKYVNYSNPNFPKSVNDNFNANQKEIRALLGIMAIINTTAVLVQMFFLMTTRAYKRVAFAYRYRDSSLDISEWNTDYRKLRSSARIGQYLLFLLVLNVSLWISDSFFGVNRELERTYWISTAYWGKKVWLFISKLLYPLLIFFRFHSATMIVCLWLNFRVKKKLF